MSADQLDAFTQQTDAGFDPASLPQFDPYVFGAHWWASMPAGTHKAIGVLCVAIAFLFILTFIRVEDKKRWRRR